MNRDDFAARFGSGFSLILGDANNAAGRVVVGRWRLHQALRDVFRRYVPNSEFLTDNARKID